ncbi:AraC family transcriptional regulator [Vibrio sp. ZSDE26]|uniref:AraC family transcriptional regulator n=1 Tax=Vibrio amylolyticus TaxID=2847292 RepID=A0A9X1XK69_9VIBR|nr:AraC family transcriptional regulator [Vibrio amylolyticus]MCK6263655.1 AraC family transcriptional regulator [Vibrio amylolyticus]
MIERQETLQISDKTHHEFIDQTNVLMLEEMGIIQCGIATCRDFFSIYRKNQQKHMLLYTIKGKGWLKVQHQRYQLEPSSVITTPAFIEVGFGMEEEEWQIAWVFLDPKADWSDVIGGGVQYSLTPISEVIYAAILSMLRSISLPIDLGGAIGKRAVEQIELLINAPINNEQSRSKIRMTRVFDLVQRQLHKDWTVTQLASQFPCSEPHFHRLCQQIYKHSPKVHVTRMRMEYAARLLVSTDWSIQHIGEIVGYPNAANFSTRFRRWSNMTPRMFRTNVRSG